MFKNRLLFKACVLGLLILLLQIPLFMVKNLLQERQAMREHALDSIAQSAGAAQTLNGPYIVVPYSHTYVHTKIDNETGKSISETITKNDFIYFLPEDLQVDTQVKTQTRKRGIYEGQLFVSETAIRAKYEIPSDYGLKREGGEYQFGSAYLTLGISDIRGIAQGLMLNCNQSEKHFLPGTQQKWLGDGIHADLGDLQGVGNATPQLLNCQIQLQLQGTQKLEFMPVGRETRVQMHADWPHPNFIGNQLPSSRDIQNSGFDAAWSSTYFATNFEEVFARCQGNLCEAITSKAFGVNFMVPVDAYVMSDRAVEYAVLFIVLTFAGCLLFEVLKKSNIHPVQYVLVSLALVMFYLLLLSLSEHMPFVLAYGLSAVACIGLLGIYLAAVMQNAWRGFAAAAGFSVLYGLLLGVLQSEDYALLLGSFVLFTSLSLVMLLTRRVDWAAMPTIKSSLPKDVVFSEHK